ncbi:hypothetical protein [Arenibacter certesii]|uniref:Magnesium citrate secondary transporter n=1 Tax=Arenibacter certesii TaxID=228955 RepID=A0A918IPA9_9FLAO|nr:hypothetical protein [Arenibacter certesii]GGW22167.1 hypothetical protein GCM10007383_01720 [Arenibacter certesii]
MNKMSNGLVRVKKIYFPVFSILGGAIYAIQRWGDGGMLPSWTAYYMNDLLCMPIVLYMCRYVVRWLKSDDNLNLTLSSIISLTLFYSLYFEVYLPEINDRYTADILDVLMYSLGAAFFYFIENVVDNENRFAFRSNAPNANLS